MNRLIRCLLFAFLSTAISAYAQTSVVEPGANDTDVNAINIVSNSELSAELEVAGKSVRVSGRMSLNLVASGKDLEEGIVRVAGWNIAMFSVPQAAISGHEKVSPAEGLLAFAANSNKSQALKYDRRRNVLRGEIEGFIDTSYLAKQVKKTSGERRPGSTDFFETQTQPAVLQIGLRLDKPLNTPKQEIDFTKASVTASLKVMKYEFEGHELPDYQIFIKEEAMIWEVAEWFLFETAKKLCVQPVNIGKLTKLKNRWTWPMFSVATTGSGLAFGQPGAATQWNKADVVFNYRDWKTIYKSSYWVTTDAGTEEEELRDEVDDDDCIEVFFVYDFDPIEAHGGGAAWGGGTAGSKIITSDANERNGVDFTHLAHELGHVLGLHHPWVASTTNMTTANTGTLMCGSGFNNDNPTINSQENKDNVSNPLLTFALKPRTVGPDCQDNADCGACP
ncbi:MAG: hypothetical protein KJN61_04600 [Gammaproteobacteria bacterium]|nr:hypothetical protein [Gammaproteobacteria bacterium]